MSLFETNLNTSTMRFKITVFSLYRDRSKLTRIITILELKGLLLQFICVMLFKSTSKHLYLHWIKLKRKTLSRFSRRSPSKQIRNLIYTVLLLFISFTSIAAKITTWRHQAGLVDRELHQYTISELCYI